MSDIQHGIDRNSNNHGVTVHCDCGLSFFERWPRYNCSVEEEREPRARADARWRAHAEAARATEATG